MTDNYLALLPELFIDAQGPYFVHDDIEIRNPSQSECGRFFGSAVLNQYGFDRESTGGHCTAWIQIFQLAGREVYMLVTDDTGCYADIKPGAPIVVGVYDRETDDMLWQGHIEEQ